MAKKKRRVYTVDVFLRRNLRRYTRMLLRPRASLLVEKHPVSPIDKHVDRHVYDKHVHKQKVSPVDKRVTHWVRTPIIRAVPKRRKIWTI
ncbi:MAG: hypothetical protein QMC90_01755 [Dehalococcoidales bacterium]|nr:hypothetical protein [Dehalococcoidales bacterium]